MAGHQGLTLLVFCSFLLIVLAKLEATNPSSSIPPCTTGWSPIYKAIRTSVGGVSHNMGLLQREKNFCINGKITDVKCFGFVENKTVDYQDLGEDVTCTLKKLRCYKSERECHDYGSSLYCQCDTTQITTPPPPTRLASTSEATSPSSSIAPCTTEWSRIYKANKTRKGTVYMHIGLLQRNENFCINGKITDVKCFGFVENKTVDYQELGQNVICDLEMLQCYERNGKCHDYGSSLYCQCDTTQSTTPPPHTRLASTSEATSPSSTIPRCTTGWSDILNTSFPDLSGEFEDIEEDYDFCTGGTITDIQCFAFVNRTWVNHTELGTSRDIRCNTRLGLNCRMKYCYDYGISLYCQCDTTQSTTPPPPTRLASTSEATSPSPIPSCKTGWSPVYNTYATDSDGDYEPIEEIKKNFNVCINGKVTDIKCLSFVDGTWVNITINENIVCSLEAGLDCTAMCLDFGISLYCECDTTQSTTPPPPTRLASTSEASSSSSSIPPCTTGWSTVYNTQSVDEDGDYEDIEMIKENYSVCTNGTVTAIECLAWVNGSWVDPKEFQENIACTLQSGLKCGYNRRSKTCHDYGIRLYCQCATTQSTTLTPASWPTSTSEATSPSSSIPPCTTEWSPIYKAKRTRKGHVYLNIGVVQRDENFCINGKITDVKCLAFVENTTVDYTELREDVTCNLQKLYCDEEYGKCHDYGSSLYCQCDTTQSTTLTPASWPTSTTEEKCATKKIPLEKTVHYFRFKDEEKGECSNDQPIQYLTECFGQCNSQTKYSLSLKAYTSTSNCCYPRDSVTQSISLHCEDNSSIVMEYEQPNSCECVSSAGE